MMKQKCWKVWGNLLRVRRLLHWAKSNAYHQQTWLMGLCLTWQLQTLRKGVKRPSELCISPLKLLPTCNACNQSCSTKAHCLGSRHLDLSNTSAFYLVRVPSMAQYSHGKEHTTNLKSCMIWLLPLMHGCSLQNLFLFSWVEQDVISQVSDMFFPHKTLFHVTFSNTHPLTKHTPPLILPMSSSASSFKLPDAFLSLFIWIFLGFLCISWVLWCTHGLYQRHTKKGQNKCSSNE